MRMLEDAGRHLDLAAELAAERPFGVLAVAKNAAEHLRARSGARDLLHLDLAVDGEEPDALLVGLLDVALLLDGVAEGNAVRGRAGGQHHLDLADGGAIEAGAELRQHLEDLGVGIGLHGVEHARVGKAFAKVR